MGRASKSTRKFQKNHLKRVVDQRRVEKRYKQKYGKKDTDKYVTNEDVKIDRNGENTVFEEESAEKFFNKDVDITHGLKTLKKSKKIEEEEYNDEEVENYINDKEVDDLPVDTESEVKDDDEEYVDLNEITLKDIKTWKKGLESKGSAKTLRKVVTTFKSAVKSPEVINAEVFEKLISLNFEIVPKNIQAQIPLKPTHKGGKKVADVESKQFKSLSQTLKQYASALSIYFASITKVSDIESAMTSILKTLVYITSFKKQVKHIIDHATKLWSSSNEELSNLAYEFLKSAGTGNRSLLEFIIKSSYSELLKLSLETNISTIDNIQKHKFAAIEFCGINQIDSYDIAVQFVRQLTLHLKSSTSNESPEAYKTVYNWQFVHSLDFWARVVAAYCDVDKEDSFGKKSPYRALIHPLVQLILGTIRLIPTPQYFGLRFYLIRSLLAISASADVYIPVIPLVIEVLSASLMAKVPQVESLDPIDFESTIRVSKSYLHSKVYQDAISDEFVDLIFEFFALFCKSIAFPELAVPVVTSFQRFISRSKNGHLNKQLEKLVNHLEENSKFIHNSRNNLEFGPTNRSEVDVFLRDLDWQKTPFGVVAVLHKNSRIQKTISLKQKLKSRDIKMKDA